MRRRPVLLTAVAALALTSAWALPSAADASVAAKHKPAPPAAVRGVKIGAVGAGSIALSWTNPSRKAVATVVRVAKGTRAPKSRTSGTAVATVKVPRHAATAIHLAPETTYTFALFSTTGHGKYSKAAAVRTVTAPAAVHAVRVSSTQTTAALVWANPAAATFTSIAVRLVPGTVAPRTPTAGAGLHLASPKVATAAVDGLTPGVAYTFGIWVRDVHGRYSAEAVVRTVTAGAPGVVTNTFHTTDAPDVTLHWTNPTAASFAGVRICRNDNVNPDPVTCPGAVDVGKATSYTDTTLSPGVQYTYWLFVHDAAGHFGPSVQMVVFAPPAAVTGVAVAAYNSTTAIVSWTESTNNLSICRTAHGATAPVVGHCGNYTTASGTRYIDHTALPGQAYDYYLFTPGFDNFSVAATGSVTMPTPAGATVEGTVTASTTATGTPAGVAGVRVDLIAPRGRLVRDTDGDGVADSDVLATTTTSSYGTYAFTAGTTNTNGIPPSNVGADVCFDATGSATGYHQGGLSSQCHSGALWDTDPERPTGTTVPLTASVIDTVDASLTDGGGIEGNVVSSPGHGAVGVEVDVHSLTGAQEAEQLTGAEGSYRFTGLNPGTYNVCYYGDYTKPLPTGLAPQCYRGAVVGSTVRPTTVTVTPGSVTRVDDTAGTGGRLTGVVEDAADSSTALGDVDVYVFDRAGDLVGYDDTGSNGAYSIGGLPTSQPLTVCVDGEYSTDASPLGYAAECNPSVAWDVVDAPSSSGTAVTVSAGQTAFVNFGLGKAGELVGQLTDTGNGFGIGNVQVRAFSTVHDATGAPLEWDGVTDAGGNYTVTGLPTGGYQVCFDTSGTAGGSSVDPGYVSQCDGTQSWDGGAPAGGTVPVTAGAAATLSATLNRAGGIKGVARSADGAALTDVTVSAVDGDGTVVASDRSDTDGSYALLGLPAGSYSVCWSGARSVDASAPSGYASGCVGSAGAWSGGGAPADASALAVQPPQVTSQDLTLVAASAGAHMTPAAAARPAAHRPSGLARAALHRLPARTARVFGR